MKTIALIITFTILSFFGYSQNNEGKAITITIDNVTSDTGTVLLGLHSENTFMKTQGLMTKKATIKAGKITVTFENVIPGDYAILAIHDKNNNNRMDFEPSGMPEESYGMSNNPLAYGPPNYNDAKFTVYDEDLKFNIRF